MSRRSIKSLPGRTSAYYRHGGKHYGPGTRRVPRFVKYVKKPYKIHPVTQELRYIDNNPAFGAISGTMEQYLATQIAQGDGDSDRSGRKVTITQVMLKGDLELAEQTAASNTSERVRLLILQDKQVNGATFDVTDFIESNSINAYRNLAFSQRFKVLAQEEFCLAAGGAAASGAAYVFSQDRTAFFLKAKNLSIPVQYEASTGAVSSHTGNGIYICAIAAVGNLVTFTGQVRVRFIDG